MSINSEIARIEAAKAGIAESITAKGVTVPEGSLIDDFPDMIEEIPSGGGGAVNEGVIFIDYDGAIVDSWTSDQVAGKSALPANPTHERLTAQGWNWTLAEIKEYISDYPSGVAVVGQMYETVSGLTEFDITLTKVTGLAVTCSMSGNKDWGDGTEDNLTTHTYSDYGRYMITCDGMSIPAGSSTGGIVSPVSVCTAARIGDGIASLPNYAFEKFYSLKSVSLPDSVTNIGNSAFQSCQSLSAVVIPQLATSVGSYAFAGCTTIEYIALNNLPTEISQYMFDANNSLLSMTIPAAVTSINSTAFRDCHSLKSIVIPKLVSSIGNYAFYVCGNIINVDFSQATSVPTCSALNPFHNGSDLRKIIVPDELYDDWIVADGWSNYSDYIYKASEANDE